MHRHAVALFVLAALSAVAQTQSAQTASDPAAVSLAQKSVMALTNGATISDVTLNANVISVIGSDYETGTATLLGKGLAESRVDLNLNGGTRSDVRNTSSGVPAGAWQKNGGTPMPYAQHNCWTDAVWFFPALSSLTQTASTNFVFKYIGQEQHGGLAVEHIRVMQYLAPGSRPVSTTDFYLSQTSYLPLVIAPVLFSDTDMKMIIYLTKY